MRSPDRAALTITCPGIAREILCSVSVSAVHTPLETHPFGAIWDTGATQTVISQRLVQQLSLPSIGSAENYSAGEIRVVDRYLINLILSADLTFEGLEVIDHLLPQRPGHPGFDLLIGMDIVNYGDLTISNYEGQTCMSFQIPSRYRTDYVKQINASRKTPPPKPRPR